MGGLSVQRVLWCSIKMRPDLLRRARPVHSLCCELVCVCVFVCAPVCACSVHFICHSEGPRRRSGGWRAKVAGKVQWRRDEITTFGPAGRGEASWTGARLRREWARRAGCSCAPPPPPPPPPGALTLASPPPLVAERRPLPTAGRPTNQPTSQAATQRGSAGLRLGRPELNRVNPSSGWPTGPLRCTSLAGATGRRQFKFKFSAAMNSNSNSNSKLFLPLQRKLGPANQIGGVPIWLPHYLLAAIILYSGGGCNGERLQNGNYGNAMAAPAPLWLPGSRAGRLVRLSGGRTAGRQAGQLVRRPRDALSAGIGLAAPELELEF